MNAYREIYQAIKKARDKLDANFLTAIFKKFEGVDLSPDLLVHKARAIQLSDGVEYSLEDAELALERAIAVDDGYTVSYLELGYLNYAVKDDSRKALEIFSIGFEKTKSNMLDMQLGMAKSLVDIGRKDEALSIIDLPYCRDDKRFQMLKSEIVEG
ncbi:hypothetical protein [Ralstonia solanacearum]|uniref:hypothetical protein n=1 Tax=Ralstonia solanacearum TaxID=305 RepID=UPI0018D09E69|nr:hypothetical protein [Ralstonia solanacearum]